MSMRSLAAKLLPNSVEQWARDIVYRRNCRLRPEQYRCELERWYWFTVGHPCDLENPTLLSEKIQWLKLWDSTPLKGRLADKYLVREWVAKTVGEEYLVPLLGVWDDPNEIDFSALPGQFVLKATHGSAWNVVVPDKAAFDEEAAKAKLSKWLDTRMSMVSGFELHYDFCEPRVIAEKYMEDDSGELRDYKFAVFDGRVEFVLAISGRFSEETSCTYYPNWTRAPFDYGYKVGRVEEVARPTRLEEMVRLAERLATGFPFARVDFYEVESKVYFGEITFTPANGLSTIRCPEANQRYGLLVDLPEKKPYRGVIL